MSANLRVFEVVGDETIPLEAEDTRIGIVDTVISSALCVLETERGRSALQKLAIEIAGNHIRLRQSCLYPHDDPAFRQMDDQIDFFLHTMRSRFPEVVLNGALKHEAATIRED
jgi:hypothetical protein